MCAYRERMRREFDRVGWKERCRGRKVRMERAMVQEVEVRCDGWIPFWVGGRHFRSNNSLLLLRELAQPSVGPASVCFDVLPRSTDFDYGWTVDILSDEMRDCRMECMNRDAMPAGYESFFRVPPVCLLPCLMSCCVTGDALWPSSALQNTGAHLRRGKLCSDIHQCTNAYINLNP